MTKKQLDRIKQLLLEKEKNILRHLGDLHESSRKDYEGLSGDDADKASAGISQGELHALGTREQQQLAQVVEALDRIENASFGLCEECGEQIGFARLEVHPSAQYCIDCKSMFEHQERQFASTKDFDDGDGWSQL